MIKIIIGIVIILVIGLFVIDHNYPDILKDSIERYKSFITCLSIISALGLIASFYITFYQQQQSLDARLSNLVSEIQVNISVCKNEMLVHYQKYKDRKAMPVPENRFYTSIIEKSISSGDIINKNSNILLWNSYRLMIVVNSLLDQALLIRHTEHIADPRDAILKTGRRSKINSLVIDSIKMVDDISMELEKVMKVLSKKV